MEQEAYRHVPYNVEIEQALLGSILVDNNALERVSAILRSEHFYDPLHQRIFETMVAAFERGSYALTPLTLAAALKADPGLAEVGGHAYFAGLAQAAPSLPNVKDFAHILHDLYVRRALVRIGEDIANQAYEAPHDKSPRAQIEDALNAVTAPDEDRILRLYLTLIEATLRTNYFQSGEGQPTPPVATEGQPGAAVFSRSSQRNKLLASRYLSQLRFHTAAATMNS